MNSILLRAASKGEMLEMIYQDNKGNISQRRIKVLAVGEESFRAFCHTKKQQRRFKLENVLSVGPDRSIRRGA